MRIWLPVAGKALAGCVCLLAGTVSCRRPAAPAPQALKPLNVVVITIDTLRPDHLGCYGYTRIETPTLDGIAQSGVLFENAVSQTPLTPPSHASIFTGLNPPSHKVRDTGGFILSASTPTLARHLQDRGWDTAAFVSSMVLKKRSGFDQGFAVYDDIMPRPGNSDQFLEDAVRRAGDTVDRAVHWLDGRDGSKPFFLWVHLYDPHVPYNLSPPFSERYKDRPYDGEIAYSDAELARMMQSVHRKSPPEKLLVAVLSDHGESLGEHGEYTHGVFLYDSTLRIAFLVSGAGVPAGMRIKAQARTIDAMPTILALLGGSAGGVEGTSLVPLFSGKDVDTEVSYAETLYPKINLGWAELRGIRTPHWKYIRAPKPELYDLLKDPMETENVAAAHPDEVLKMEAWLAAANRANGPETVRTNTMDERTQAQLKSLGYLSGTGRSYGLGGQGADPKDRLPVLKLIEAAELRGSGLSPRRRIEALQEAVRLDPSNPVLYHLLGPMLETGGRYAEATALYRAALAQGIVDGRLHSRIADLLVRDGHQGEAIPEYEISTRLNPGDTASQVNLATAYMQSGRAADADRVFQAVIAIDPSNAAAQNGLGVLAIQRQDGTAARAYFEKAVELDPNLAEAHLNLGLLYKMAGDRERARASFERFLAKAPPRQYKDVIPKVRAELDALH